MVVQKIPSATMKTSIRIEQTRRNIVQLSMRPLRPFNDERFSCSHGSNNPTVFVGPTIEF
jgi:hypothetical protein